MLIETAPFRIDAHDVDELNYSVSPWDLEMRQLTSGQLHAQINFIQLDGILLNHEHWSQSIGAVGASPANFLALGGCCTDRTFKYNGAEIDSRHLCYGFDAAETEFVVPVDAEHWVILVPKELIIDHLGEEAAADLLREKPFLECTSGHNRQLMSLVDRGLEKLPGNGNEQVDGQARTDFKLELLDAITEILLLNDSGEKLSTPRKRYLACRKAMIHAMKATTPIRVPELAAAAGVSQRVLELGFRETLGMSPKKFMRLDRLNKLHRDLLSAQTAGSRVTEICNRWGFSELGRTAGEYRQLFGENPSSTLRREIRSHGPRLADALPGTTGR